MNHITTVLKTGCWTHIMEASRWLNWYPNSNDVEIQGGEYEMVIKTSS
jgi:hypothetical protein